MVKNHLTALAGFDTTTKPTRHPERSEGSFLPPRGNPPLPLTVAPLPDSLLCHENSHLRRHEIPTVKPGKPLFLLDHNTFHCRSRHWRGRHDGRPLGDQRF